MPNMALRSCDASSTILKPYSALGAEYGFKIVEDASHAIGSRYNGVATGACQFSDIAIFSLHPVKVITTGEGGIALTNQDELAQKMALFRSHGVTRDPQLMKNEPHGGWYYEQVNLGYNYRMTDVQAALGRSQLNRLDRFVLRRNELAKQYLSKLEGLPLRVQNQPTDRYSSFHLFVVRLNLSELGRSHAQVFEELRAAGIGVNLHYMPVYLQPYYQELGFEKGACKEAEAYYSEAITLPLYQDLSDENQDKVVSALQTVLR